MNYLRALSILAFAAFAACAAAFAACETETPTTGVVVNAYPAPPDGGDPAKQTVVFKTWWVATYFPDPVPGGAESSEVRTVPASDFAYAVLTKDWDPASATPPTTFIALKSKAPISAARGNVLHITVSDQTFTGNCDAKQPLSQDDADFITQRIFPGQFAKVTYDAKTCTSTPVVSDDGGADGGDEGGAEGGPDGGGDGSDGASDARPG